MQTLGVFGAGDIAGAPQGGVIIGRNFIDAGDQVELFVAVQCGSDPIACAVNVEDLAGFGNCVDGRKVYISPFRLAVGFFLGRTLGGIPLPEHFIMGGEFFRKRPYPAK